MSDIPNASGAEHAASAAGLGRKIGPLPVWAWAVGVIALVAVVYYVFRKSSANAAATSYGQGNAALSGSVDQTAAGALSTLYGGSNSSGYQSRYSNQNAWEQAAISEIPGSSSYTPLQVQDALNAYTSGGLSELTSDQSSIINQIISALGPDPESVSGNTSNGPTGNPTGFFQYVGSNVINATYANGQTAALTDAQKAQYSPTSVKQVSAYGNPFTSFAQNVLGGTVYGIDSAGNTEALTGAQWAALGQPNFSAVKYDPNFNPNVKQTVSTS